MSAGSEETLAVRISRVLADRIVAGEIGPGERLRQDRIAEEFGASHVPVREAFRRLEAQGLAISEPRRGVRVAAFDLPDADNPAVRRDSVFASRIVPRATMVARMPFVRNTETTQQVIEPIVGFTAAPIFGDEDDIPNNDSLDFEFDANNLFRESRYPGIDRVDGGVRVTYGLRGAVYFANGGSLSAFLGQSYQITDRDSYPAGSGLDRPFSNIVGSVSINPIENVDVEWRFSFDSRTMNADRNEVSARLDFSPVLLVANYTYANNYAEIPGSPNTDELSVAESALRDIVRYYTRESGVRNLERELARLARKSVRKLVAGDALSITVTPESLEGFLGVKKYRFGETEDQDRVGLVTGLAWTEVGGDLLTIEAVTMPGRGQMKVTGNLRDVMKESISAANSFVQSRAPSVGIKPTVFRRTDIHVHVPEGATPKDGPSAGIAMVTAIVSALTGNPVRKDVAMTGEVTLRGRVLPIGGLKEKLLAALRGGVKTVLIPMENKKDLSEVPDNVKAGLTIIPVETVDEVLSIALAEPVEPVEWTEADEAALAALPASAEGGEARAH